MYKRVLSVLQQGDIVCTYNFIAVWGHSVHTECIFTFYCAAFVLFFRHKHSRVWP